MNRSEILKLAIKELKYVRWECNNRGDLPFCDAIRSRLKKSLKILRLEERE